MSKENYRLYSFVANHYLSPLQCGLQTAHVVSELSRQYSEAFNNWAFSDKTIIICGAGNHKGVTDCFAELEKFVATFERQRLLEKGEALPHAIFHEDAQSMNCMATACGILIPQRLWDVSKLSPSSPASNNSWWYLPKEEDGTVNMIGSRTYYELSPEHDFIEFIKSFRLA